MLSHNIVGHFDRAEIAVETTYGPKRPMEAVTSLPVFGSMPSLRAHSIFHSIGDGDLGRIHGLGMEAMRGFVAGVRIMEEGVGRIAESAVGAFSGFSPFFLLLSPFSFFAFLTFFSFGSLRPNCTYGPTFRSRRISASRSLDQLL